MDLQNLFTMVINMSVTGSIVIGCVLAARLLLRRAPRVFSCVLWLAVLLRLLCPVSIQGPASVLELVDAPRNEAGAVEYLEMPVQAPLEMLHVEPGQSVSTPATDAIPVRQPAPIDWNLLGSRVWAAIGAVLLGYGIVSYVNLKRRLRESVPLEKGVREADGIASPFVLGRTVYLPAGLDAGERAYILLHERLHIRHGDPIVKAIFWLAVCIHWFNPLVWLSFLLCGRDMELRCDEAVLKRMGGGIRSDYAQSLLDLAAGRPLAPAPLAFGEGDTGKRVKFVLNWKKRKLWMAIPAAVLCAVVLVLTGCDPAAAKDSPFGHSYKITGIYASPDELTAVDGSALYTLTADRVLIVRQDSQTVQYEAFRGIEDVTPTPEAEPEWAQTAITPLECAWVTADGGWRLFQREDGALFLLRAGEYMVKLERTDLLGITIRQPGMESYVEPVWYQPGHESWYRGELSTTPVDSAAEIILTPETDVDKILVSEEYYEAFYNGETNIITTDYFLDPDENGNFVLNVARRGTVGDDHAVYRVTVGEEQYLFQLTFPVVPGETSVSITEELREVTFSDGGAWITLQLPWNWEYSITTVAEDEYNAGIDFWPTGREEGKLHFGYYPSRFGVCGTGLETSEMTLAGRTATVGTFDDHTLWDYISFGEYFAVWGHDQESWWAEYGDTAMEILDTAQFGT